MISSSHTLASMRFERAYHTSASSISRDARSWTLSATAAKLRSPVVSTRGAFSSASPSCLRSSFSVFLPSFRSASSPAIVSVCSSATLSLFSFLMARCRGSSDRKLALPERRATVLTESTSWATLHALRWATSSRASFDLFPTELLGWNCHAVMFDGQEFFVANLGVVPGAPRLVPLTGS